MPDDGTERRNFCKVTTAVMVLQFTLGIGLWMCGFLTIRASNGQIDTDLEGVCQIGIFIVGFFLIVAGILSIFIQVLSIRDGVSEHESCIIYTVQILCVLIFLFVLVNFCSCILTSLTVSLTDCDYAIGDSCGDKDTSSILPSIILSFAAAIVSILTWCCSCKYARYYGIERHFCNISRPENDYRSSRNLTTSVGVVQPPVMVNFPNYPPSTSSQPPYDALQEQNRLLLEQIRLQQQQLELQQQQQQQQGEEDQKTPLATAPPASELPPPSYEEYMGEKARFQQHEDSL